MILPITTQWLRDNGYNGPRAYWTPYLELNPEQQPGKVYICYDYKPLPSNDPEKPAERG